MVATRQIHALYVILVESPVSEPMAELIRTSAPLSWSLGVFQADMVVKYVLERWLDGRRRLTG